MNLFQRRPKVLLYTTPDCADCAAVKRYLEHRSVPYQEKDVAGNSRHLEEMRQAAGVRIAPVTVVGKQAFYGTFGRQHTPLETALREQGLIKEIDGH